MSDWWERSALPPANETEACGDMTPLVSRGPPSPPMASPTRAHLSEGHKVTGSHPPVKADCGQHQPRPRRGCHSKRSKLSSENARLLAAMRASKVMQACRRHRAEPVCLRRARIRWCTSEEAVAVWQTPPGFWLPGRLAEGLESGRAAGQDAVELAA
jgi:hypothetical protein